MSDIRNDHQPPPILGPRGLPDPAESPWRTRGAREIYRNPWLAVAEYAVLRPDGRSGIYGVVDPGDNATIVALDDDQNICLVGEFLYPLQQHEWMPPSGKIEVGEEPEAAARRELAEETGITAEHWSLLGRYALSPGISTQISHIFLARGLHLGEPRPEATELVTLSWLPLADTVAACLRGEIRAAAGVLGIWHTWLLLGRTPDMGEDP